MVRPHIAAAMFELPVAIDEHILGAIAASAPAAQQILLQIFGVVIKGPPQFHQQAVVEMKAQFAKKLFDDLQADQTDVIGHDDCLGILRLDLDDAIDITQDKRRRLRLMGVRMGAPKADLAVFDHIVIRCAHDLMLAISRHLARPKGAKWRVDCYSRENFA